MALRTWATVTVVTPRASLMALSVQRGPSALESAFRRIWACLMLRAGALPAPTISRHVWRCSSVSSTTCFRGIGFDLRCDVGCVLCGEHQHSVTYTITPNKALGHTRLDTTTTYLHVSLADLRRAVARHPLDGIWYSEGVGIRPGEPSLPYRSSGCLYVPNCRDRAAAVREASSVCSGVRRPPAVGAKAQEGEAVCQGRRSAAAHSELCPGLNSSISPRSLRLARLTRTLQPSR